MDNASFEIRNFRSVHNSGPIKLSRITSLLGRNESGKTNLLLALRSLNPPEGVQPLSKIKDFPRHRRLEECFDRTAVVETLRDLNEEEQQELAEVFPRAEGLTQVSVGRYYRWVRFEGLKPLERPTKTIKTFLRKIKPAVLAAAAKLDEAPKKALGRAGLVSPCNVSDRPP